MLPRARASSHRPVVDLANKAAVPVASASSPKEDLDNSPKLAVGSVSSHKLVVLASSRRPVADLALCS